MSRVSFEVEFRWKEQVIYWEGDRGCVFVGGWGIDPLVTVVPDVSTWDDDRRDLSTGS